MYVCYYPRLPGMRRPVLVFPSPDDQRHPEGVRLPVAGGAVGRRLVRPLVSVVLVYSLLVSLSIFDDHETNPLFFFNTLSTKENEIGLIF